MKDKVDALEKRNRELKEELEKLRLHINFMQTRLEVMLEEGVITKEQAEKALVNFPPEFQQMIRETVLSKYE
ncbi:MAG TPA: hypothetical protein GX398_07145 [Candidatus Cloacimonetes bacterium]|jgi:hypothetical protein|nr:hypothetical protein [Candidatus Cloacimonas sp.]HHZ15864.1 hypothetical protein [Candidatus Cloacimonadota bacterium]